MQVAQQVVFLLVLGVAVWAVRRRVIRIRQTISLGRPTPASDNQGERWKNVVLVAFGQSKMFKRPLPAIFHFFIYAGFLIINLEVLEFIIDGLAGTHRIFAPLLGSVYPLSLIHISEPTRL